MPSRTFDGLDFINVTGSYTTSPSGNVNSDTPAVSISNVTSIRFSGSGSDSIPQGGSGPPFGSSVDSGIAAWLMGADCNFSNTPGVPLNARIIEIFISSKYNGIASASSSVNSISLASASASIGSCGPIPSPGPPANDIESSPTPNPSASVSVGTLSETEDTATYDAAYFQSAFGRPYCTYNELVALAGTISLNATLDNITAGASGLDSGVAAAIASLSYNFGTTGYTIRVTWQEQYQWDLQQPDEPVEEGTHVTITSDPEEDPLLLDEILTLTLVTPDGDEIDVPSINWLVFTPYLFTFIMPSFGAFTPSIVYIVITSTQFSGSVTLGSLITLFFTSASGIYRLVIGKTADTLYIEEDLPTTVDVKIPNPTARTGFFGG